MSVYDINGNTMNSVYTVDGTEIFGGIPSPNIVDNATCHRLYTKNETQTQGACIDDDGNIYEIYYKKGKFLRYNIKTKTATEFPTFTSGTEVYGHANGMCYNPNTEYIYIAPSLDTGEVYVIDPSDMTLYDTLYAYQADGVTPINVWNICYDRTHQMFICMHSGTMYFYDDAFNLIKTETYDPNDWALTRQDIETDGEYIYVVSWKGNGSSYQGVSNDIHVFSMLGEYLDTVTMSNQTDEPEDLCYDWNTGLFYVTWGNGNIDFINMKAYNTAEEVEEVIVLT